MGCPHDGQREVALATLLSGHRPLFICTQGGSGLPSGGWSVDLGLRKIIGDWSISLNCRDLFDSRKWRNTTIGPDYEQTSERWRGGRTFRITVKYSFRKHESEAQ